MSAWHLQKMKHEGNDPLRYWLGDIELNDLLGKPVRLEHTGNIACIECARKIKKTFQQGYCFPCIQKLACCDSCIVKPELCHYAKGTCREPEWGERHCLIDHVVYLAKTTHIKVGVTGAHKVAERWGDQGATEAMVIAVLPERLLAGQLEVALKGKLSDRTDWRGLILGRSSDEDIFEVYRGILSEIPEQFEQYLVSEPELQTFSYPVEQLPDKVKTANFDKDPVLEGDLHAIRGQYLIIDGKAINIRKFQGYEVRFDF